MRNIFKKFRNWIKLYIYVILYIALLMILSGYILINWEKCITMKFFEQFDGNNILFLVWIVLLILSFYDIEAKGWKFRRKGIENMKNKYDNAESDYIQEQINNMINSIRLAESDYMQNQINNVSDNIQSQNSGEMDGGNGQ